MNNPGWGWKNRRDYISTLGQVGCQRIIVGPIASGGNGRVKVGKARNSVPDPPFWLVCKSPNLGLSSHSRFLSASAALRMGQIQSTSSTTGGSFSDPPCGLQKIGPRSKHEQTSALLRAKLRPTHRFVPEINHLWVQLHVGKLCPKIP